MITPCQRHSERTMSIVGLSSRLLQASSSKYRKTWLYYQWNNCRPYNNIYRLALPRSPYAAIVPLSLIKVQSLGPPATICTKKVHRISCTLGPTAYTQTSRPVPGMYWKRRALWTEFVWHGMLLKQGCDVGSWNSLHFGPQQPNCIKPTRCGSEFTLRTSDSVTEHTVQCSVSALYPRDNIRALNTRQFQAVRIATFCLFYQLLISLQISLSTFVDDQLNDGSLLANGRGLVQIWN